VSRLEHLFRIISEGIRAANAIADMGCISRKSASALGPLPCDHLSRPSHEFPSLRRRRIASGRESSGVSMLASLVSAWPDRSSSESNHRPTSLRSGWIQIWEAHPLGWKREGVCWVAARLRPNTRLPPPTSRRRSPSSNAP
jgi:hypothetical protein